MKRRLPGEDHISGIIFYSSVLPAGFSTTDRIKSVNQPLDAEALGIVNTTGSDIMLKIMHYHVAEFYRINPGAKLFIAVYDEPIGALTFAEVETVMNFSENKIRNLGIFTKKPFVTSMLTLIQGILTTLDGQNKPISDVLLAANLVGITTAGLSNLRALAAPKVSGVLAQDGANEGAALFTTAATYSITAMGALLGAVSKSKVNECIGWVEKFQMNSVELDVPAFANGDLVKNLTDTTLAAVDGKGWIFLLKYDTDTIDSGVYFNDSHTAVPLDSDYAYIENNRTMDKAIRSVRKASLPKLNGPVNVDPQSGQLDSDYVSHLEATGDQALSQMAKDKELSGYQTFVNPEQNVITTSQVEVTIINVPVGVSRSFLVNVSYATKLP